MPIPTPPPVFFPVNFFQDGTAGILLATDDIMSWISGLVIAQLMVGNLTATTLPQEEENLLSVILLPV